MILKKIPANSRYHFYLFSHRPIHEDFQEIASLPHVTFIPGRGFTAEWGGLWFNVTLPMIIRKMGLRIFWGSQQVLPPFLPRTVRVVLTYYDLVLYFFPEAMRPIARIQQRIFQGYSVRRSDLILSISTQTMLDMIERFGYPRERARVSLLGCDMEHFSGGGRADRHRRRVGAPSALQRPDGDYILAVSTIEPRKNYATLLAAYERYASAERDPLPLVIVGKRGWESPRFFEGLDALISRSGLVRVIEDADDAALDRIYRNCAFFVMASLYEGFGLPLLEALCRGKYAVVSDIGPFREIGGERIAYLPATDVDQWRSALIKTARLYRSGKLKGVRFDASKWGWDRTARVHTEAFDELAD
jgi:glycosyltransferase involved in cell wall biosynthesis